MNLITPSCIYVYTIVYGNIQYTVYNKIEAISQGCHQSYQCDST